MVTYNMEIKNTAPILTELLSAIHKFNVEEHVYVSCRISDSQPAIPAALSSLSAFGIRESALPDILNTLGIRSLTLNAKYDLEPLYRIGVKAPGNQLREFLKDSKVIEVLRSLFSNCHTIAFDDWATLSEASVLWHELLINVIKPIHRADLQYIFYLGDPMEKLFFEVDEALDLIGAFSGYGKATLALDENEAVGLWRVLNGVAPDMLKDGRSFTDLKKKYFSIFRTMNIENLLVYSANDAILYAGDQQFVLSRKKVDYHVEIASNARQNFIAGYSMGLLMRLEKAHCIALGLIVFGSLGELKANPEQKDIYGYIQNWLNDLQKMDEAQLYEGQ